ncbi:hypothetical protein NIES2098_48240 [Calothrix sp. NIES-2098]|nr:hypothetical protein NIES2098_48240 [Calothrix sp. NIES-2098]
MHEDKIVQKKPQIFIGVRCLSVVSSHQSIKIYLFGVMRDFGNSTGTLTFVDF